MCTWLQVCVCSACNRVGFLSGGWAGGRCPSNQEWIHIPSRIHSGIRCRTIWISKKQCIWWSTREIEKKIHIFHVLEGAGMSWWFFVFCCEQNYKQFSRGYAVILTTEYSIVIFENCKWQNVINEVKFDIKSNYHGTVYTTHVLFFPFGYQSSARRSDKFHCKQSWLI